MTTRREGTADKVGSTWEEGSDVELDITKETPEGTILQLWSWRMCYALVCHGLLLGVGMVRRRISSRFERVRRIVHLII
jgi:hypothetical protein